VIGFVGRLTRDKGIPELYQAFGSIRTRLPDVRLLLVGDCEDGDPVPLAIRNRLKSDPSVIVTGFVADVAPYYWNMDVLAFPSHREGFPCVPLEAQAASVPVVCSDATGAFDAIVDGITGIRVPAGDVDALTNAISKLLIDPDLRVRMGMRGQLWVEETFKRETVWNSVLSDYLAMIERPPGAQTQGTGTR
jgi:glycosyltransferase involved in cell wall biosynthesis